MRVGGEFLRGINVGGAPVEEEADAGVDDFDVQRRVNDALPQWRRGEDGAPAKEQVEDLGRGLDEGVDDAIGQPGRRHGGRESDKDIDLGVELWVERECGESLRGALGETDVAEGGLGGVVEDVGDAIWDVVEGELIDGEVPKGG